MTASVPLLTRGKKKTANESIATAMVRDVRTRITPTLQVGEKKLSRLAALAHFEEPNDRHDVIRRRVDFDEVDAG